MNREQRLERVYRAAQPLARARIDGKLAVAIRDGADGKARYVKLQDLTDEQIAQLLAYHNAIDQNHGA